LGNKIHLPSAISAIFICLIIYYVFIYNATVVYAEDDLNQLYKKAAALKSDIIVFEKSLHPLTEEQQKADRLIGQFQKLPEYIANLPLKYQNHVLNPYLNKHAIHPSNQSVQEIVSQAQRIQSILKTYHNVLEELSTVEDKIMTLDRFYGKTFTKPDIRQDIALLQSKINTLTK